MFMILLLFTIVALVLFGTSYLLYAKQAIFHFDPYHRGE